MRTILGTLAQPRAHPIGTGSRLLSLAQRTAQALHRLWLAYRQCQTRRAAVLMLQALDDRTLADVGLSRSEIMPAVYGSGRVPRILLASKLPG
jgi:uncharacterized protein YjiS (DUF1127 family)